MAPQALIREEESAIANGAAAKVRKEEKKERKEDERGPMCLDRTVMPIQLTRVMSDGATLAGMTHSRHVHCRNSSLHATTFTLGHVIAPKSHYVH
jgi:hypothetical protein